VQQVAQSRYTAVVLEPDATSKRRAVVWSLVKALLLAEAAEPYWRVDLIDLSSKKVVKCWKKEPHESAMRLKELLDRDLAALTPEAFEAEWSVEVPDSFEKS
jgi:hypothetical protein